MRDDGKARSSGSIFRHEEVGAFAAGAEAHLTSRGVRGELWPRQSASHQWALRLPTLARTGARHRGVHSFGENRHRLFSRNSPGDGMPSIPSGMVSINSPSPAIAGAYWRRNIAP